MLLVLMQFYTEIINLDKSLGQAIMKPCEHKNKANKTKLQDDITE